MSQQTIGHPVHIPVLQELTLIEKKSSRLVEHWREWEILLAYAEECNEAYARKSAFTTIFLLMLGKPGVKERQASIESGAAQVNSAKDLFHHTIKLNRECYHQILEYEKTIKSENIESNCLSKLSDLWDMFAYGEDYYNNKFLSYYGEYKQELDKIIHEAMVEKSK